MVSASKLAERLESDGCRMSRSSGLNVPSTCASGGLFGCRRCFSEKVAQFHFDGGGDARQRVNGDSFFAAFDFTDVFGIEVGALAEVLLRQFHPLSVEADGFSQDSSMS